MSILLHSGMNSRCRVNGSRTLEPRQHHSTQEKLWRSACGLTMRPGGVLLVSYEDALGRLGARLATMVFGRKNRP